MKFRSRSHNLAWPRPTYQDLVRHYQKYGLDNHGTGYRGADETYRSYSRLATDALVEVAFDHLGVESYVAFIETIGYGKWVDQARQDWEDARKPTRARQRAQETPSVPPKGSTAQPRKVTRESLT